MWFQTSDWGEGGGGWQSGMGMKPKMLPSPLDFLTPWEEKCWC